MTYGAIPASADLQLAIKYDPEVDRGLLCIYSQGFVHGFQLSIVAEKPKEVDNWTYKARNSVLFHLEDAPLTAAERMEQARRNQRVINKTGTRFSDDIKIKPSEVSESDFVSGDSYGFPNYPLSVVV